MKKNLVLLTGIAFLITILVADGCKQGVKQKAAKDKNNTPQALAVSENTVDVFLKDTLILGEMHLLVYDSKRQECEVIDNHTISVKPGYTVKWKNAKGSKIDEIKRICRVGEDSTFFGAVPVVDTTEADRSVTFRKGIHKLIIPPDAPTNTIVKYKIVFTVKMNTSPYTIDPYIRIEDNN